MRGTAVRHTTYLLATGLFLAACATEVPDSGRGVGYSDFSRYELERARREAELTGQNRGAAGAPLAGPTVPADGALAPAGGIGTSELAAVGIGTGAQSDGPLGAPGLDLDRTAGVQASPSNAAVPGANPTGISDEQNFDAVAMRESIESDAARRAAQAAAYEVVQPTALPSAPRDVGPNIVEYALSAPNRRGQEWYSRSTLSGQARFERNCAGYRSPDEAQRDFLERGGPERDPRGIDPDGDGFACGWDPAPFLAAVGRG